MRLVEMIFYWAKTDPHRLCLIQPELLTTYQALAEAIQSTAARIEQLGLDRREPIGLLIRNPSYLAATAFAALHSGYCIALVRSELLPLLQPIGIRNLIYDTQGLMLSGGRNIRYDQSWVSAGTRSSGTRPAVPQDSLDIIFFTSSGAALSLIDLHRIDVAVMSAAQAAHLADARNANPSFRLDSVKALFMGGGKIDPQGIANIRAALCRNVINQYGSTEAGVVALTPLDLLDDQPGAIPLPWAELQIVDQTGRRLPPDEEGLIRYRTPQLSENLKRAGSDPIPGVRDGWFYPGDMGALSANGVLHLTGRSSDVINRGGVKVSGTRIEEILKALPQIKDAAACGVVGASGFEEIWIAVVPAEQIDIQELKEMLRKHADIGIAPDEIFLLDALPTGELGKVQKSRLRELLIRHKKAA
jgi:acyl-CoA synthetase (AMP-forming)/AMP-acid ligase II